MVLPFKWSLYTEHLHSTIFCILILPTEIGIFWWFFSLATLRSKADIRQFKVELRHSLESSLKKNIQNINESLQISNTFIKSTAMEGELRKDCA